MYKVYKYMLMKMCCQLNVPDIPLHYGQSMPVNNR